MSASAIATTDDQNRRGLTGWRVLWIVMAFFGTIGAVNAAMIYFAISTFRGQVDPSPYEHGLGYEKDIAAAHAQAALGWKVDFDTARTGAAAWLVGVSIHDREGTPVRGLSVTVVFAFPADTMLDRKAELSEAAPGVNRGRIAVRPGRWDTEIKAARSNGIAFRSRSRIVLK